MSVKTVWIVIWAVAAMLAAVLFGRWTAAHGQTSTPTPTPQTSGAVGHRVCYDGTPLTFSDGRWYLGPAARACASGRPVVAVWVVGRRADGTQTGSGVSIRARFATGEWVVAHNSFTLPGNFCYWGNYNGTWSGPGAASLGTSSCYNGGLGGLFLLSSPGQWAWPMDWYDFGVPVQIRTWGVTILGYPPTITPSVTPTRSGFNYETSRDCVPAGYNMLSATPPPTNTPVPTSTPDGPPPPIPTWRFWFGPSPTPWIWGPEPPYTPTPTRTPTSTPLPTSTPRPTSTPAVECTPAPTPDVRIGFETGAKSCAGGDVGDLGRVEICVQQVDFNLKWGDVDGGALLALLAVGVFLSFIVRSILS